MSRRTRTLPDDPWRYFERTRDAFLAPVASLVHGRPKRETEASRFMAEAYAGRRSRREPLLVGPARRDGTRLVLDGNSTLDVARASGWRFVAVREARTPAEALARLNLSVDNARVARDLVHGLEQGQSLDLCGIDPPVCVGNLGIPRSQMPQLMGPVVRAFLADQRRKGRQIRKSHRPAGMLRATQREINAAKVAKVLRLMAESPRPLSPVIVSSDGYILDGHHRWAARVIADPVGDIPVWEVDAPIRTLLKDALAFDGVERRSFDSGGATTKIATKNPRSRQVTLW